MKALLRGTTSIRQFLLAIVAIIIIIVFHHEPTTISNPLVTRFCLARQALA